MEAKDFMEDNFKDKMVSGISTKRPGSDVL